MYFKVLALTAEGFVLFKIRIHENCQLDFPRNWQYRMGLPPEYTDVHAPKKFTGNNGGGGAIDRN